jgi:hypothetical protein
MMLRLIQKRNIRESLPKQAELLQQLQVRSCAIFNENYVHFS